LFLREGSATRLQALLAVARKILHAIFGMFRHQQGYDGQRLFPQLVPLLI
jgi:transposase